MSAIRFHREELDNGLTIVGELNPAAQSVAAGYFVRAGARDETGEISGVSHFLEHMTFKGTQRRSADDINREFDELGARNNAYTSEDHTVYYGAVLPERGPELLDLLTDMMRPALRQEDFDLEKNVILEEIAMYQDRPHFLVFDEGQERFYDGHPAGNSILGTPDSIGGLTSDRMRAYFEERYAPDNLTLVLTGAFDWDAVVRQVDGLTAAWTPLGATREHPPLVAKIGREEKALSKLARAHVALFAPGWSAQSSERYAAALIASCVGDASSGRLYWELVDRGIADAASLSHDTGDGVGAFVGYLSTAQERLEQVMEIAHGVLGEVQREGLDDDEWARARIRLATGITLGAETPFGRLMPLGRDVLYRGETRSLQELVDELMATELEEGLALLATRPFDRAFTYVLAPEVPGGPTHPEPPAQAG